MEILPNIINTFKYYKQLGLKSIQQCSDEGLFYQFNEDSNSIALIVQHIYGNMMSRWTDFLNSDGEKTWRNRDGEFELSISTRAEILNIYEKGWNCMLGAIQDLSESQLSDHVLIRNKQHTVLEAINRQLAHIPYHIGQIVYLARMHPKEQWESLSIPKGKSKEYNQASFSKGQRKEHYTKQFIHPKK